MQAISYLHLTHFDVEKAESIAKGWTCCWMFFVIYIDTSWFPQRMTSGPNSTRLSNLKTCWRFCSAWQEEMGNAMDAMAGWLVIE
jgi:hypothetical protein